MPQSVFNKSLAMSSKRKAYWHLSSRQKRRRAKEYDDDSDISDAPSYSEINMKTNTVFIQEDTSLLETTNDFQENPAFHTDDSAPTDSDALNSSESDTTFYPDEDNCSNKSVIDTRLKESETKKSHNQTPCQASCEDLFRKKLAHWATNERKLPADCLNRLLNSLNESFPSIPKTAGALKSLHNVNIKSMGEYGDYVHFDNWVDCCAEILNKCSFDVQSELYLTINIDGIPLYTNSKQYTAYPILVKFTNFHHVVCAGIYCTNTTEKKLPDTNMFLERFITELLEMKRNGLHTNYGIIKVKLGPFVCDAPMRSYLKQIISHSGYSSCERCEQKGEYHGGHVSLLQTECPLRTNASFNAKSDGNHHIPAQISPLEVRLNFPMVSHFVLDYMHLTCIGIMKRLLLRWKNSKPNCKKCHLSPCQKTLLDNKLSVLSKHIPSDFPRKFESTFMHISHWKATEYRLMMVYVGAVLLAEKFFPEQYYQNFLLLLAAMRVLLSNDMQDNIPTVRSIIKQFIEESATLYGKEFVSYNVHSLLHLPDDYAHFGNLQQISAFPFESYLGTHIKASVHSGYKPLHQIAQQILLDNSNILNETKTYPQLRQLDKSSSSHNKKVYKKVAIEAGVAIGMGELGARNNAIILRDHSIAIVSSIFMTDSIYLEVQKFGSVSDFFSSPLNSSSIGIYKVDKLLPSKCILPIHEYKRKLMLLPFKSFYVALELLHCGRKL